jgi:hypothetical protein
MTRASSLEVFFVGYFHDSGMKASTEANNFFFLLQRPREFSFCAIDQNTKVKLKFTVRYPPV